MNRLITILFLGITTIIMQAKTDKEQIETLYRDMYEAMVAKDTVVLNRVQYIKAITNGTLNYFSADILFYSANLLSCNIF